VTKFNSLRFLNEDWSTCTKHSLPCTHVRIGCYRCRISVPDISVFIPMFVCRLVTWFEQGSSVCKMESLTEDYPKSKLQIFGTCNCFHRISDNPLPRHFLSRESFRVLKRKLGRAPCVSGYDHWSRGPITKSIRFTVITF
jgi:hypothetical protein